MTELQLPALYVDEVVAVAAPERPVLINRDPGPGGVGVPIQGTVALEVVDPGPNGIDRAQTRVWVDGQIAFDGSNTPEISPFYAGPAAEVVQSSDTLRIVLVWFSATVNITFILFAKWL